jgi:hypothetical protein
MQSWFPVDRCCVLQNKPTKANAQQHIGSENVASLWCLWCVWCSCVFCAASHHAALTGRHSIRTFRDTLSIHEYTHIHTHLSLTYTPRIERWMELRRVDLVCFLAYTLGIFLVLIHVVFYLILLQQLQDCQCEFGARGYKLW